MTLVLVFAVNLLFIAIITGLVHRLGRSVTARLDSAETAKALFLAEFPAETVTEIAITGAGDGALLALEGRPAIGLVKAMGVHWLVRRIEPESFTSASATPTGRIVLRLADFASPRLTLDLGNAASAGLWRDRLQSLRTPPAAARSAALKPAPA